MLNWACFSPSSRPICIWAWAERVEWLDWLVEQDLTSARQNLNHFGEPIVRQPAMKYHMNETV